METGAMMATKGNRWLKTSLLWITLTALVLVNLSDSFTIVCSRKDYNNEDVTYTVHVITPSLYFGSYESYTTISPNNEVTRDVIIYWEGISNVDNCNGNESYKYNVYRTYGTESGLLAEIPSNYTYANFAVFSELSIEQGYTFIAYLSSSTNVTSRITEMYVPMELTDYKPNKPVSLTKTKIMPNMYELRWINDIPPYDNPNHFLLFWCVVEDSAPNQCNGEMNTKKVNITTNSLNISVYDPKKDYQFAIISNSPSVELPNHKNLIHYVYISGGMLWETCAELPKSYIESKVGKVTKFWATAISSTYIGLRWKLDCIDRMDVVKGYQVYYCPVAAVNNSTCIGSTSFKYIEDTMRHIHIPTVFVENLNPATTYKMAIEVLIRHESWYGLGLRTSQRYFTTKP